MKIAWIGVGVMGENIIKHLINSGYEVFVYNRTLSKCNNILKKGAKLLNSIEEAPLVADIIFTMVGYPKDVEDVYLGVNGLIKNIKKGQLCVDLTTSSPNLAKNINEVFAKKGVYVFDIPVTGGDIGAKNGQLTLFVGGNKEIFEKKILNIVNNFAKKIEYFGESGMGQYAKLGNQIAIATTMISIAESYKFAKTVGLDTEKFLSTIATGSASSFSMSSYSPRILKNDFKPGFFIHHFIKDMKLALEECERYNIKLPGLNLVYNMYNELTEEVKNYEGTQAIIKYYK